MVRCAAVHDCHRKVHHSHEYEHHVENPISNASLFALCRSSQMRLLGRPSDVTTLDRPHLIPPARSVRNNVSAGGDAQALAHDQRRRERREKLSATVKEAVADPEVETSQEEDSEARLGAPMK